MCLAKVCVGDPLTSSDDLNLPPPNLRSLAGGVLMGLANLVPGISGGTMILAIGLYDRFIGAVADVTRLRFRRDTLVFLGLVGLGLVAAVLSFSGLAVSLVSEHRWVMYSLFIGLTLGGIPELLGAARMGTSGAGRVWLAIVVGMASMAWMTFSMSGTQLPATIPILLCVGALAASSMILPGISGSYILLILGMYDMVVGSLSLGALREDWRSCAAVVVPIVLGAGVGIGLLSNVLKWVLERHSRVSHGVLLGLLCGSVFGLFPFQTPIHPELANKNLRKAIAAVHAGEDPVDVMERKGLNLSLESFEASWKRHEGKTSGQLKAEGEALKFYRPGVIQILKALGLCLVGVGLTRLLGRGGR